VEDCSNKVPGETSSIVGHLELGVDADMMGLGRRTGKLWVVLLNIKKTGPNLSKYGKTSNA
jgi:hypothetical protein